MVQAGYDYSNWDYQYIPEPTRNEKRIQKKRKVSKNTRKNVIFKISIIAFAYALLLVYLCIKSATLGYEIVSLENEIQRMETSNKRMEYAIAQKTSLDIIEKRAIEELGMLSPGSEMSYAVAVVIPMEKEDMSDTTPPNAAASDNINDEKPLEKLYASLMLLTEKNNL